ncbi:MAG: hypothetical protein KDC38_03540 [Planctomycetes bacterium]|nr:hypothetical protein [Planctomycetota bacterium]
MNRRIPIALLVVLAVALPAFCDHYEYSFILEQPTGPCAASLPDPQGTIYLLTDPTARNETLVAVRTMLESFLPAGEKVYIDALSYGLGRGGYDPKPESFFQISIPCRAEVEPSEGDPKSGASNDPNEWAASTIYEFLDPPRNPSMANSGPGSHGRRATNIALPVAGAPVNVVGLDLHTWEGADGIYFSIDRTVTSPSGTSFGPADILYVGTVEPMGVLSGAVSITLFKSAAELGLDPADNIVGLEVNLDGEDCCEPLRREPLIWTSVESAPGSIRQWREGGGTPEVTLIPVGGFEAVISDGLVHDDPDAKDGKAALVDVTSGTIEIELTDPSAPGLSDFDDEVYVVTVDGRPTPSMSPTLFSTDSAIPTQYAPLGGDDPIFSVYGWRDRWHKARHLRYTDVTSTLGEPIGVSIIPIAGTSDFEVSWSAPAMVSYQAVDVTITNGMNVVLGQVTVAATTNPVTVPGSSEPGVYTAEVHGSDSAQRSRPGYGRLEISSAVLPATIISGEELENGDFELTYYVGPGHTDLQYRIDGSSPTSPALPFATGMYQVTLNDIPEGAHTLSLITYSGSDQSTPTSITATRRPIVTPVLPAEPRYHDLYGAAMADSPVPAVVIPPAPNPVTPGILSRTFDLSTNPDFAGMVIRDLEVELVLEHGFAGDITIDLIHPSQTATLYEEPGSGRTRIVRHLDDLEGFSEDGWGTHEPSDPAGLSVFDGLPADVAWTLRIQNAGALSGEFVHWRILVSPQVFVRGDCNADGNVDVADAVFSLASLFIPGTSRPPCADACDTNDDGNRDVSDSIYLLTWLFVPGSSPPPGPFPNCDIDPTLDGVDCQVYASCP